MNIDGINLCLSKFYVSIRKSDEITKKRILDGDISALDIES
jgi:hypothetical protein